MGIWQDIRYAARVLTRSPGFALVVVLSLALGIGANTAIFSLANGFLLRPMPVKQPARLVAIYLTSPKWGRMIGNFSYPELLDFRKADTGLSDLMGFSGLPLSITGGEKPELIWGEIVTGNYFSGMGIRPILGRGFLPDEDRAPGKKAVCVLSYNFWRQRFQSDPDIAGKKIQINGSSFTIVGVAPRGFLGARLFAFIPDVWVPVTMQQAIAPNFGNFLEGRDNRWIELRGRLKPGVTRKQAEAALNVAARRLAIEYPQTDKDLSVGVIPGGTRTQPVLVVMGLVSATVVILFGVVGLVLLVACTNVANLLLARAGTRAREMAVRVAVGASRVRLVRQLLTESVLLSLAAAGLGIVLCLWFNDALKSFYPTLDFQTADLSYDSQLDWRVFAFSFLLALLASLVFGLAPALRASKVDQAAAMKGDIARPLLGFRWLSQGNVLVMVQVAISCVLLISGGLFLRSMVYAHNTNPGFDRTGVQLFSVDLGLAGYDEPRGRRFERDLVENLRKLPGAESASLAFPLPLDAYNYSGAILPEGYVPRSDNENHEAGLSIVGPQYFETMGTRLVAGRGFDPRDTASSRQVAVVNEAVAERYWQTPEKALGKRFKTAKDGPWVEIVGVAKNGKYFTLGEGPTPYFFLPVTQSYQRRVTFLVRTKESPETLGPAIRQVVRRLDPALPIFGVRTMPQFLNRIVSVYDMEASLVGAFAIIALLLASVGIYGVLHFAVSRRTREIGIRMALGAGGPDVIRLVLSRSMAFVVAGLTVGIAGAAAASGIIGAILGGISPTDPITFACVVLVFILVAIGASAVPARRASRVDPMEAVRYE